MHEEDYGILWKHHDLHGGTDEVRRSRRLVVSFIATVGNYEYGFYWYFYLDGTIQLEVKLTGIVSTDGDRARRRSPSTPTSIAPGLAAPHHQHLFCARLDLDVDGAAQRGVRGRRRAGAGRARQPVGQRVRAERHAARHRARRRSATIDAGDEPGVADRQPESSTTRLGQPVGYKLVPTMSTPTLLAAARARASASAPASPRHNLWVTPYAPDERRAAGEYPNQHAGGDGLPALDRGRPLARRHRRRALVHVRRHPLRRGPRTGR